MAMTSLIEGENKGSTPLQGKKMSLVLCGSGRVWFMALVLKTSELRGSVGSNPTCRAKL